MEPFDWEYDLPFRSRCISSSEFPEHMKEESSNPGNDSSHKQMNTSTPSSGPVKPNYEKSLFSP